MPEKKKQVLSLAGLLGVFGILLALATAFDLQISHMLADGNLVAGSYYSVNPVCNIVEIAGAWPVWAAAVFAASVLTVYFNEKKGPGRVLKIFFFCLSVIAAMLLLRDGLKYAFRIYGREELLEGPGTWLASFVFGLAAAALVLKLTYRRIRQNLDSLLPLALAVMCSCCCYFIIEIVKSPMGRMRFRGMHLLGDYSAGTRYTPWYQVSAAGKLLEGSGLVRDCFKSFPSGHTFSAGMSYVLIMLPDVFPRLRTGKGKMLSYAVPLCYTGFVGFFRIAAGAHFFSDVLVGGTLAYVAVQLFRYVFLYRNRRKAETVRQIESTAS
ncbi:MAG: phosphatase PAP2 family protein [Butyrivibrio sp.]|nr:phosphatase PAP2 family protein [Butyrivibrio sp.]